MDHRDGLGLGRVADVGPVHRHAAEPDLPDIDSARSERSRVSSPSPTVRPGERRARPGSSSSGARNASEPGSLVGEVGRVALDSRTTGSIVNRARARARASIVPPTNPSTRNVRKLPRMSESTSRRRLVADHACPILVAEQRRCRTRAGTAPGPVCRGRAARRIGDVEQLPSGLVVEDAETRPEPFDHRPELGQSAPGLDVHHGRRSVSARGTAGPRRRWMGSVSSGRPSHDSAVVHVACPLCPTPLVAAPVSRATGSRSRRAHRCRDRAIARRAADGARRACAAVPR